MPDRYSLTEAESMGLPVFQATEGNAGIRGFVMNRPVCVVGARCLVHLPLPAQTVSKAQALIVYDADGIYLRDLASRNQTFINDRPVREARLNPSDIVRFGPFSFRCHSRFETRAADVIEPAAELWLDPDGLASRQVMPLHGKTFLIGSRSGCDLHLRDSEIALAHAVLFLRDGHRYLRDLSTMTGTTVNGQRIREVELAEGDEIQVAGSRIRYRDHAAETAVAAEGAVEDGLLAFAETVEEPALAEVAPASNETIRFDSPPESDEAVQVASEAGDQIVLPWDEPEPIELELADSRRG